MRESDYLDPHACSEFRELSRRNLMRAMLGAGALSSVSSQVTFAEGGGQDRDVLIHVFLRGGMDGLTTCVPYGDPDLYTARPTLAIAPPGNPNGAVDLDGFFGLAPAAAPLAPAYQAGHLAFVHASGSTDPTRSHFEAFSHMEFGIPEQSLATANGGWLARHLQNVPPAGSGLLRGVSLTRLMPKTLLEAPASLPITDLDDFDLSGPGGTYTQRRTAISDMYALVTDPLKSSAADTLATIDLLASVDFENYQTENNAAYLDTEFGNSLRDTVALIKADLGVECAMLEIGGWDTHADQGVIAGRMAGLLDDLCQNLAALYLDTESIRSRLIVVVMSEFGRRVAENASGGTDHGHGNCMMVLGGSVQGGQVLTSWPGLDPGSLDSGDLSITMDYRNVLSEILQKRMDQQDLGAVFPNFAPVFPGLIL